MMTDAGFTTAGYAIMIEDDPNQMLQSRRKTFAPIALRSKTFNHPQHKLSIYAEEFLAIYFAFSEFRHLMWGSVFPLIVFTNNRSVPRFFQTKMIPPPLWNACDYVIQYNYVIAHVVGTLNTDADFFSRPEVNPTEKLEVIKRNDVTTQAIEVNIQSTGVAEVDTLYLLPEETPIEQPLWDEKETLRKTAKVETHNDPEKEVSKLQSFHKPTASTIDYEEEHFKNPIRTKQ